MHGTKLTAVKLGICALISSLKDDDMMNITAFSGSSCSITSGFQTVRLLIDRLPAILNGCTASGMTAFFDTVVLGIRELRTIERDSFRRFPNQKSAVIALTDGQDNKSQLKSEMVKYRLAYPGINNFMFISLAVDMKPTEADSFRSWMEFRHCKQYTVDVKSGSKLVQVFREMLVTRVLQTNIGHERFYQLTSGSKTTEELNREDNTLSSLSPSQLTNFPDFLYRQDDDTNKSRSESVCGSYTRVDDGGKQKEVFLDSSIPDWNSCQEETVMKFPLGNLGSLQELLNQLEGDDLHCVSDFPDRDRLIVKCGKSPFAKGDTRCSFYGQQLTAPGKSVQKKLILKESLSLSLSQLTKPKYESFLACHYAAKVLSIEFNKIKPSQCSKVEFVDAFILHFMGRKGQPFMTAEEQIEEKFEKYNNNSGYVSSNPTENGVYHEAIQCFSHWTCCFTKNKMLVVDCQGGYSRSKNTFLLTDPAIHYVDVTYFGNTNMGKAGMRKFFETHNCNEFCRQMRLVKPTF